MGKDTYTRANKKQVSSAERPKLEYLHKVIAKVKDGLYPVDRIAYLDNWDYFILETGFFKVKATPKGDAVLAALIRNLENEGHRIGICVEDDNFWVVWKPEALDWRKYESDKSDTWVCEIDTDRLKLPAEDDIETVGIDF